jgi:hypothetical protein
MKLPGVYYAYAGIMALFGQSPAGIHGGMILVTSASAVLVFLLGRRLGGLWVAAFAGPAMALLSLNPAMLGLAGHAGHFVVLFALLGTWLLLREGTCLRRRTVLAAGGCFGLAFLMKQPAIFLVAFGMVCLVYVHVQQGVRNGLRLAGGLGLFLLGAAVPYAVIAGLLAKAGLFGRFWFWTVSYALSYGTTVSLKEGAGLLLNRLGLVAGPFLLVWGLAVAGLAACVRTPERRPVRHLLAALLALSFLTVSSGLYFRSHYFLVLLPAVALLAGFGLADLHGALCRCKPVLAFPLPVMLGVLALATPLVAQRGLLFQEPSGAVCRKLYGRNPFPEAEGIARYLAGHTNPGARIAVLGSEPEIPFLAHRPSATGYIYTYALMEAQPYSEIMQRKMIEEIEAGDPPFVVFVNIRTSWLPRPGSPDLVFTWFNRYREERLEPVVVACILPDGSTQWVGEPAAATYSPRSNDFLVVYRQRRLGQRGPGSAALP